MVWVILAAIGVPLWLCAIAVLTLVFRNRALRKRPGNVPVRVSQRARRARPGHAVWISDVFVWRGSPAAWKEELEQVSSASFRPAGEDERGDLHRLGDDPVIASLTPVDGGTIQVAARREHAAALLGPFGDAGSMATEGASATGPEGLGAHVPIVRRIGGYDWTATGDSW